MSDNGRKASVVYEGNGSQTIFLFPFDYLRKAFIYAQDVQNENVTDLVQGVDFEMDNSRHIHLKTALKAGHILRIFRKTTTQPLVEWQDASVLRSADLTLQEVQLLHLAEETSDKVTDSAGLTIDPINKAMWNANFKRIGNVLDPIEPQDVLTLNYIMSKQDNILNQIKRVGQNEINELSTTYNAHKSTLERTGKTERQAIERKGTEQVSNITDTANEKLNTIKTKGDEYVSTQTTLKEAARSYADQTLQNKNLSAGYKDTAQKWAESTESPDNTADSESDTGRTQSSRSWALLAKTLYAQIKRKMEQLSPMLQQALSSLSEIKTQQSQIQTDMVDAKNAKTEATAQAKKSKEYAALALDSANAAKQSAKDAAKFDPSSYNTQEENDKRYVQKATADNTYLSKTAAKNTYLTQTDAYSTYLTQTDADNTYMKKTGSTFLTTSEAENTYLSKSSARYTYLSQYNAQQTYLSKSDAESTYMKKTGDGGTFLTTTDAANKYLSKIDAMGKYLTQTKAESTYATKTELANIPQTDSYSKTESDRRYQSKGSYLSSYDVYYDGKIKLPNGAKIGVE